MCVVPPRFSCLEAVVGGVNFYSPASAGYRYPWGEWGEAFLDRAAPVS